MGLTKILLLIFGGVVMFGLVIATITLAVLYAEQVDDDLHSTRPTRPPVTAAPSPTVVSRINCFPEEQGTSVVPWTVTRQTCESRGCTYDTDTGGYPLAPPCYMHREKIGYRVVESCQNCLGGKLIYARLAPLTNAKIFDPPITNVRFTAIILNDNHLQFKIEDGDNKRYEVPFVPPTFKPSKTSTPDSATFYVQITQNPFSFRIIRKQTGVVLFDTSLGGLVFSNRFLQLTTRLPSSNFYGLGEHEHPTLKHNMEYQIWPMFARDQPGLGQGYPLYGVHPFYMILENDGNAHGVFLMNSNAMEFNLIPVPGVIVRTIGGIFDFHLYTGPTPANVVQQHTEFVGRPYLPPYWSLGFHIARWGYSSLKNLRAVVDRTREYSIPLDVVYADIDHMDKMKDFTLDQAKFGELPNYLTSERKENGLRSVMMLDPAITNNATDYEPWKVMEANDVFVKWPNGSAMFGYEWPPGKACFPDFFLNRTKEAWKDLIVRHSKVVPFDALWIDMNEPSNFGTNEEKPWNWPQGEPAWSLKCQRTELEDPPYRTYAISRFDHQTTQPSRLSDKTLCMEAVQNNGTYKMYDVHNVYGLFQSKATAEALLAAHQGKRGFLLSRSTFAGSGHYVSHWLGDNSASWPHLRHSIIGILEMSLFGIPHTGTDICGFLDETTPELCRRWMQLGAFYPYSRNHNALGYKDQDPGYFGPFVADPSRDYMQLRYKMLPYIYTLFYYAHVKGDTVARPLFFEFAADRGTWSIDTQFMLGPSFLVAAVVDNVIADLVAYLPSGKWLDVVGKGQLIDLCHLQNGQNIALPGITDTSVFQRGGSIVAYQRINNGSIISTKFTRRQPIDLTVILDCDHKARGSLFWDDGESLGLYWIVSYEAELEEDSSTATLKVSISHNSTDPKLGADITYATIAIYGLLKEPTDYEINYEKKCTESLLCRPIGTTAVYDSGKWVLTSNSNPPIINSTFEVTLQF